MKQQGLFSDFIYQVFSLIISLIVDTPEFGGGAGAASGNV